MKKFFLWFVFFFLILAAYAPAIYQLFLFVLAWVATILAIKFWKSP